MDEDLPQVHFSCIACEATACGAPYNYTDVNPIHGYCMDCPDVANEFLQKHLDLHIKNPN